MLTGTVSSKYKHHVRVLQWAGFLLILLAGVASAATHKSDGYRITWDIYPYSLDRATDMVLSPDGTTLAVSSRFGHIRFFNLKTRALLKVFNDTTNEIRALAYSADGSVLASAGTRGNITLWDTQTGEIIRVIPGPVIIISSLAFSLDGQYLAAGAQDRTIKLWNYRSGQLIHVFNTLYASTTDQGEEYAVYALAFSPDSTVLAASVVDNIQLWQLSDKKLRTQFPGHFLGNPYSPDGSFLAVSDFKKGLVIRNAADGRALYNYYMKNGDKSISFSPDSTLIATGEMDGINLFDVNDGVLDQSFNMRGGYPDAQKVLFSADNEWLITSDFTNQVGGGHRTDTQAPYIRIWDVETAAELYLDQPPPVVTQAKYQKRLYQQTGPMAISPDGKTLITRNKLWNAATLAPIYEAPDERIQAVAYAANGQVIALGQENSVITLLNSNKPENHKQANKKGWSAKTIKILNDKQQPKVNYFKQLVFSDDASLLGILYKYQTNEWVHDNTIRVIDLKTGKTLWEKIYSRDHGEITCDMIGISFSKNNSLNAICSDSGAAFLYNINTSGVMQSAPYQLVEPNTINGSYAPKTSFSADGRLMAISYGLLNPNRAKLNNLYQHPPRVNGYKSKNEAAVNRIQIWDLHSKKLTFQAYDSFPSISISTLPIALSADGTKLATGGLFSTIWLWDLKTQQKHYTLRHDAPREQHEIKQLLFSPDGEYLYSIANGSYLGTTGPRVFDLKTRKERVD